VLRVAADRTDIAAVVALIPMVDGLAAGRPRAGDAHARELLKATALGIRTGRVASRAAARC